MHRETSRVNQKIPIYLPKYHDEIAKHYEPWVFTEGTDVEAETPIFWPPDLKS